MPSAAAQYGDARTLDVPPAALKPVFTDTARERNAAERHRETVALLHLLLRTSDPTAAAARAIEASHALELSGAASASRLGRVLERAVREAAEIEASAARVREVAQASGVAELRDELRALRKSVTDLQRQQQASLEALQLLNLQQRRPCAMQ